MDSWVFLLLGGVGAIGAALTLGTLAALVQLRRTGTLPNAPEGAGDPSPADVRRLWVRMVIGVVVAVVSFSSLAARGLLVA